MLELGSSGSVRGGGGNAPTYSASSVVANNLAIFARLKAA